MNNLLWILANCGLLVAAYGVTVWVRDYEPPALAWAADADEASGDNVEGRLQPRKSDSDVVAAGTGLNSNELDELWEKTLFRPERTEDVVTPDDPTAQEEQREQAQMELIGVGKIGDKPVAIILEKAAPRRRVRRLVRGRPRSGKQEEEDDDDSSSTKTQHIYREGSEVGSTGYTVSSIGFNEVVLVRGDEEMTLRLEAGDDQSQNRRDKAVASEKAREAKQEAEETAATKPAGTTSPGQPPPPPPPPPMAAPSVPAPTGKKAPAKIASGSTSGAAAGKTAALSREERLKRAKLLRERILQRRQEQAKD